ncbi:MAG: prolipoprotein diacylglyceryl transferase [Eubacteriales bacterium]|nr:prolipoprotein diacylglyceryl transferase [Eubacteriales bacterium]
MIKNIIGFPGLGIEFSVNETAFTLFGIEVQWYGIILTAGIICAFLLFYRLTVKVEKIPEDHILNISLITVPVAIIGARITYVLTNLSDYDSFWDAVNIRNGGIAVYGSIIFGLLSIFTYCRIKKQPFLKIIDIAALAMMVGQIIGRWGNFMNGEAYGDSANIAKLPWRMTIQEKKLIEGQWVNYGKEIVAHPTFLYESLWNLIGFIVISRFYKNKKKDGQIVLMYLAWYGLGRGFIEILRTDSCGGLFGEKIFVYLGFGSFIVCTAFLVWLLKKAKKDEDELKAYESVYGMIPSADTNAKSTNTEGSVEEADDDITPDEDLPDEDMTDELNELEPMDEENDTDEDISPKDDGKG